MSESTGNYSTPDTEYRAQVAQARAAIEEAILTLRANKMHITGGQEDAIKKIIYGRE